jgi:hypothetical protein
METFWHNFRLIRSRLRGEPKAVRLETYSLLRGGMILAAVRGAVTVAKVAQP